MRDQPPETQKNQSASEFRPDRALLLNIIIYVQGALLLLATIWCWLAEIPLAPVLVPQPKDFAIGAAVGVGLILSSFVLFGISHLLEKGLGKSRAKLFLSMKEIALNELAPLFQTLTFVDVVVIALLSGFCEEVFFRGALQLDFNLWISAGIFGMFHMPTFRYLLYGLWAAAAGILFGIVMDTTHSLWAPITAHALNNLVVIMFFRYGPIKPATALGAKSVAEEKKDLP